MIKGITVGDYCKGLHRLDGGDGLDGLNLDLLKISKQSFENFELSRQ